jgi:hypothetical protein
MAQLPLTSAVKKHLQPLITALHIPVAVKDSGQVERLLPFKSQLKIGLQAIELP